MAETPTSPETPAASPAAPAAPASPKAAKSGKGTKKGKSGKSAKPASTKPPWTYAIEKRWAQLSRIFKEVGRSLLSPDWPSRKMALLFFVSCFGVVAVFVLAVRQYRYVRSLSMPAISQTEQGKNLSEFFQKEKDVAAHRFTMQSLGDFTVELKGFSHSDRAAPGVVNVAEVELVVECDNAKTCGYVADHMIEARNQVTDVLLPLGRDDLMSLQGKKKVKKALVEKLNLWIPKGKIEAIYFSKLIMS